MARSTVVIKTRDGETETSVFRPDVGDGPWPAVLVYQDGRGVRQALFELGQRIASAGYYVLLPDLFYRAGPFTPPDPLAFSQDVELRKQWQAKYMATASKSNIKSDTAAFLDFLAKERDVSSLSVGTTGYCMGGSLSLSAAGNFPDRVVAAASYHGGNLATDDPESPHLLAPSIKARVYVAGAIEDASFPDSQKRLLTDSLVAAGVPHTIETYPAKHGWVPTDSVVYDRQQSDRHYASLLTLFEQTLRRAPKKS
ncbi:MAG TPA: dienelactone hydrolase family protein [Polyangiaceae bacterium]|jgi:carboxymethylenebutenolidase|nr:dienelactone hydrolase family protein [Polyangiaceae bacterium]